MRSAGWLYVPAHERAPGNVGGTATIAAVGDCNPT